MAGASVPGLMVVYGLRGPVVVSGEKGDTIGARILTSADLGISDVLDLVRQSSSIDGSTVRVEKWRNKGPPWSRAVEV